MKQHSLLTCKTWKIRLEQWDVVLRSDVTEVGIDTPAVALVEHRDQDEHDGAGPCTDNV